jgi:transposase
MRSRVELFESIRRDSRLAGMGIRALARKHHVHRRTVRQALLSAVPLQRKQAERPSPVLDAWKPLIRGWVTAGVALPKQAAPHRPPGLGAAGGRVRRRAGRVDGAQVRRPVAPRAWRRRGVGDRSPGPPSGQEAEVDFAELWVWLEGTLTKLWLFTMRLSASGRAFHQVFATQAQEAFFEGHVLGFAHFGGVPCRVRYDNSSRR